MRKKGWIVSGLLLAGVAVVLIAGLDRGSAPGIALFVGRFHPTIVHFPIALLLMAAAIELLAPRSQHVAQARPAVPFLLAFGALSALAAVVLGYLLSLAGGYEEGLLSLHLWLGIVATLVAAALALVSAWSSRPGRVYRGMLGGLALLIVLAGHFGGSLARGSGYLTYYLPQPIKALVGIESGAGEGLIANVDSAHVFQDLIQPVLDRRCVDCHGPSKSKGDLRLDTREGVEEGGRDGPALVAGNPAQSEMVRRITLPPFDEDAMPPDGEPPLDVGETELIRWWIAHGASFDLKVGDVDEIPTAVTTYLARVSRPRSPERSGIFALEVPAADTGVVAALENAGLRISLISPDAPFLHVSAASIREGFSNAQLEELRPIAAQVAVLDLGHTGVGDPGAAVLRAMPHLIHLHLEGTTVSDEALRHLSELEHLEYLNLYGTRVTDRGIEQLQELASLRAVYLWQTQVTEAGAASLRRALPAAEVNLGTRLALVSDTSSTAP